MTPNYIQDIKALAHSLLTFANVSHWEICLGNTKTCDTDS